MQQTWGVKRGAALRAAGTVSGMSLVELLIVLAIMGILATVAIPRYVTLRQRAQQSEAKANLPAILLSERAHFAEFDTFTDDLSRLSWRPEGAPKYLYGFASDAVPQPSGVNDSAELAASGYGSYRTDQMVDAFGIPLTETNLPAGCEAGSELIICAAGNIDNDGALDQWTQTTKTLRNVSSDIVN